MSEELIFQNPPEGKNLIIGNAEEGFSLSGLAGGPTKYIEDEPYIQFTNQDLQIIINNPSILDINGVWNFGFRENMTRYESGIYNEVKNKLIHNVEISDNLLRAFLIGYAKKLPTNEEVFNLLIDRKAEDTVKLVALEDFSFENFDKEITRQINEHLEDPLLSIDHLQHAVIDDTGQFAGVYWVGYGSLLSQQTAALAGGTVYIIPLEFANFFDRSLYFRTALYTNPITFTLRGNTNNTFDSSEVINNVRLPVDTGFSTIELTDSKLDSSLWGGNGWFGQNIREFVKKQYRIYFVKILSTLKYEENRFDYNKEVADLKRSVSDVIKTSIDFGLYEDSNATITNRSLELKDYVGKRILDAYRYKFFLEYSKAFAGRDPSSFTRGEIDNLTKGIAEKAELASEQDSGIQVDPELVDDEDLTEEEIKNKQKFLKQCILMSQLESLKEEHLDIILQQKDLPVHQLGGQFLPYSGRFYMIKDGEQDQSSTISKLLIPSRDAIREFLDIKPSTAAFLVPKLRFYKVFTNSLGKLEEFEFKFRKHTDSSRIDKLMNTKFDRGGDYGIKSFNISFDGTSPATAKNDIKADLSLYFQSFGDFISKKRSNGNEYSFADLLLLPKGNPRTTTDVGSNLQYSPSYYRIRADVGWVIDSARSQGLVKTIGQEAVDRLVKSLRLVNKTYYLNMVDHSMDFREDGSVDITVNYRAYVESALKGTSMDALADKNTRKSVEVARRDYELILNSGKCTTEELNKVRRQLGQIRDLLKKQSLQSIFKRLINNNAIRFKKANKTDTSEFARSGFLSSRVRFEDVSEESDFAEQLKEKTKGQLEITEKTISDTISTLNTDNHLSVSYFYMADLLYVILDSIYNDGGEQFLPGAENFKFILTSFEYQDTLAGSVNNIINIGSIPISTDLFAEWFTENVLKSDRTSYPIMYFIRDLCKYLIVQIMSETCFKSSMDRSLMFKTSNFLGEKNDGIDPFTNLLTSQKTPVGPLLADSVIIDISKEYGDTLPLGVDDDVPMSNLMNYIAIYAHTPTISTTKEGNEFQDGNNGIIHFKMGRDRGILKKIKFAKTDMQYLREARYFNHGSDGLLQLAAVYKVTLDMIGNTLYYPGMQIFINPMGFLGASEEADPTVAKSVANKLGFGGYHLVTSVKSSIAPGKFTTTVDALFHYSGDGRAHTLVSGKKDATNTEEINSIEDKPEGVVPMSDSCNVVYSAIINKANDIVQGRTDKYTSIEDIINPQQEQEPPPITKDPFAPFTIDDEE